MSKEIELPRVPSQLLEIALRDMKATIKAGLSIRMQSWGGGNLDEDKHKHCSVCFAGSVMLQTTKKGVRDLEMFDPAGINKDQYSFLDAIRKGHLGRAINHLDVKVKEPKYFEVVAEIPNFKQYYEKSDKKVFFAQIEDLIKFFKSHGL